MSRSRASGVRLQITLPDPDEDDLLHVFSVDPELVRFLYSLLDGKQGEAIAAKVLDATTFARAVCDVLVTDGKLICVGEGVYGLAE